MRERERLANGKYKKKQSDGYGRLAAGPALREAVGVPGHNQYAHRVIPLIYDIHVPEHRDEFDNIKELDHLCGVRRCCNPDHLEVVSKGKNNERSRQMREAMRLTAQPTLFSGGE